MTDTGSFLGSLAWVTLAAWALLPVCRSMALARQLADGFAGLCIVVGATHLLGVLAVTLHAPPSTAFYRGIVGSLGFANPLIAGVAVAAALASLSYAAGRPAAVAFVASSRLAAGLAWFVAFAFAGFEIGKAAHDAQMRQFFLASGYPVAFMYAVMAAEVVGAFGLLVARVRLAAAGLLGLAMLGAMATHARNGDPFADSLDALRMLLLVTSIAVLHARRPSLEGMDRQAGRIP